MGEFTINGKHNLDIVQQADVELYKPTFRLPGSHASGIKSDYGNFLFQESRTKNFSLWLSEYRMTESALLYGAVNNPVLELHCMLTGGMEYQMNALGNVAMPSGTFNMCQQPYVENRVFLPKNSQVITFNIHFQPEYLYNLCTYYPQLDRFVEQIIKKQFSLIQNVARPLTIELTSLIRSILAAPLRPIEQSHILSAAIDTFVCQALSYLTESISKPIRATDHQRKAVAEVRLYMESNLDQHTLIPDLAHQFAINDCQLKMLFKEMTGSTIFQYLTRERMAKAARLLRETNLPVEEIAFMVGYQDASGFGYRFKKMFFLSPLQYRISK